MSVSTQELISTKGRPKELPSRGNKDVEDFYNRFGWKVQSGQTGDEELFWPSDAGPLRAVMERQRLGRVLSALREAGPNLSLVEAGCGGNPATHLLPLCARYTGVDFRKRVSNWRVRSSACPKCHSTSQGRTFARYRSPTVPSTRAILPMYFTTSTTSHRRQRRIERYAVWCAPGLSRHVSESNRFGTSLLRVMTGAERVVSKQLVRLGNYVLITVTRGR